MSVKDMSYEEIALGLYEALDEAICTIDALSKPEDKKENLGWLLLALEYYTVKLRENGQDIGTTLVEAMFDKALKGGVI